MIRHIVLWQLREDLDADRMARFAEALERMSEEVPSISASYQGRTLRLQDSPFDYVLELDFADEDAFRAYKDHPAHRSFIEQHARPCVVGAARAQIAL